jgi:hypothetical protein
MTVTATAATNDNAQSITNINGYALSDSWKDGKERIRDIELGERLEYTRTRDIRALTSGMIRDGKLKDVVVCGVAPQTGSRGGRPATEYWFTETQALKVIAKSETAKADAILDEVIAVFVAWRHGRLAVSTDARLDEALLAIRTLQEMLLATRAEVAALRDGVISRESLSQLRADVRRIATLECAARRWPSVRAATLDIYREMGWMTGWGGKGQPWKLLPATLAHTAFTVLRSREASIRRELRALADDRQLVLEDVPLALPPKKKSVH